MTARVITITDAPRDDWRAIIEAMGPFLYASILIGLVTAVCAWALYAIEDFKSDR